MTGQRASFPVAGDRPSRPACCVRGAAIIRCRLRPDHLRQSYTAHAQPRGVALLACQGRKAIPPPLHNAALSCRPVAAPSICHPCPQEYWPDNALNLAGALLATGAETVAAPGIGQEAST